VVGARIAEMLEETLAEAETALPVEAMQEHLRWYQRLAGLTNAPPPVAAPRESAARQR